MQDYDLTLFPQSKIRLRLGYSRNVNEGPGLESYDSGVLAAFHHELPHHGKRLPRGSGLPRFCPKPRSPTTNTSPTTSRTTSLPTRTCPYLLPGSVPVDLGIVWNTAGTHALRRAVPGHHARFCKPRVQRNHRLIRGRAGRVFSRRPSVSAFNPAMFKNLELSGAAGYSTSNNQIYGFQRSPYRAHHANRHARQHHGRPGSSKARCRATRIWAAIYTRHRQASDRRHFPLRQLAHSRACGTAWKETSSPVPAQAFPRCCCRS